MEYYQKFKIEGVASTVTYDDGLHSSKENPKRILSVIIQTTRYKDNDVQLWLEAEKIAEIPDYLIDCIEESTANKFSKSFNRLNEIGIGHDIPVGATLKAALSCGTSTSTIRGIYRYEIYSG